MKLCKHILVLLALVGPVHAWSILGDNILGQPLDYVTIRQKNDGYVLTFRASDGKWVAASSGGGGAPSGSAGGDLAGSYPNPTVAALAITAAKMATSASDRLNPAPAAVGNIPVDAGAATPYTFIDGSDADTTKALFATGASTSPAMRAILAADITEKLALSDLTDVIGKSGTGNVVLMSSSPTFLGTITGPNAALGSVTLADQTVNATSTGILSRNGAQLSFHDGTSARDLIKSNDSRLTDARTPTAHNTSHQNGGSDEVATATSAANAIPKAGAGGNLSSAWIDEVLNLADLLDVTFTSLANNDILMRIGGVWVNAASAGDVTWTGSGNVVTTTIGNDKVTTAKILNANVTLAKLADQASQTLLGRGAAGTGVPAACTLEPLASVSTGSVVRTFPAGIVMFTAASSPPAGTVACDGSAISRTGANAALFAAIGTTYGAGNGSTTFNVPDITGRVIAGKEASETRLTTALAGFNGSTLGATGGDQRLQAHTHTQTSTTSASDSGAGGNAHIIGGSGNTGSAGGGNSQNVQPTIILLAVITL